MEKDLTVGIILKPQGIRGEIKVKPLTDDAEAFYSFKRVYIDEEERKVLSVRMGAGVVFLGLSKVPDRNAAELLRGKELKILRADAPELEEGSYYIEDLLESKVYFESGTFVGTLKDIRKAATDIYTLETEGGEVLFPLVEGVVEKVDVEEKEIILNEERFKQVAVL